MQCCEQEYHKRQLVRYQPFLERRGDWTYCALAIRWDDHEVKTYQTYQIQYICCYNNFPFFCQTSFQRRRWQLQRQCEEQVWRKGDVAFLLVFSALFTWMTLKFDSQNTLYLILRPIPFMENHFAKKSLAETVGTPPTLNGKSPKIFAMKWKN